MTQHSMEGMMANMSQALFPNGESDVQAGTNELRLILNNALSTETTQSAFTKAAFVGRMFGSFDLENLRGYLGLGQEVAGFNETQLQNCYRYLYSFSFVNFLYQRSASHLRRIPGIDPTQEPQFYIEESWEAAGADDFTVSQEYHQNWLRLVPQHIVKFSLDGVQNNLQASHLDELPEGTGKFGLEVTNPIPTFGVPGIYLYLHNLQLPDGQATQWQRTHAVSADNISSIIDEFQVYDREGNFVCNLYLNPYHKKVSEKAPEGFQMHPDFGLMFR